MLPKVRLEYGREFNRALNAQLSEADFIDRFGTLKARCLDFEALLGAHCTPILEQLEKLSGYQWRADAVKVHIVEGPRNRSFADPLTIQWHPNPARMLLVLVHELGHALIPGVGPGREASVNNIVERIALALGLARAEVAWLHEAKAAEDADYLPFTLDLEEKSLREWEAPLP